MITRRAFTLSTLAGLLGSSTLHAQPAGANYDERLVPRYTLPPILRFADGRRVSTRAEWPRRREELLASFGQHVYGRTPDGLPEFTTRDIEGPTAALNGRAWRQQVRLEWGSRAYVDLLVFRPRHERPVPVFVGLNFFGNHAVHADPAIRLSERWMRTSEQNFIVNHRATERSRGMLARRWPVDLVIEQDCALATAYYGDLAPDDPAEVTHGIAPLAEGRMEDIPTGERWAAIGMWAWGLSQMRKAVSTLPGIDATRAIAIGHSRLGKAAVWAGAQDEQFAMVVSNNSGEGGASLSRRMFGETVAVITRSFPHWFCPTFATYADRVPELPVDQHQLLALIAPRVLYVASAVEDRWADPRGEFLSAEAADEAWRFLGARGLGTRRMPSVDTPVGARVRYHVRRGGHDITHYDWTQYLAAAKQELV